MPSPEKPTLEHVADGCYVRQAIDNIGWVNLGGYAVIIDALEQPSEKPDVMRMLKETLGDTPVRYVLNTHTHYDHIALNEDFSRELGADVINAGNTKIPAGGRLFEGDARSLRMIPMPDCHTRTDCVMWIPGEKVLFTGDLFGWGILPITTPLRAEMEARLLGYYKRMIGLGAETVVPGHGPLCDTNTLDRFVEYYHRLKEQLAHACAGGKSDDAILNEIKPPEDMRSWWRFAEWKHRDTAGKVLTAVRRNSISA